MAKRVDHLRFSPQSVEHSSFHDDNIVPPSEEVAKLAKIDPSFIPWIQTFVTNEQAERFKAREAYTDIEKLRYQTIQKNDVRNFILDILILIGSIGLVLAGLYVTYQLVLSDRYWSGTLVGSVTLGIVIRTIQRQKSPSPAVKKK